MVLLILAKGQESQIDAHGAEELDTFPTSDTDQTFFMFPFPKLLDRIYVLCSETAPSRS